MPEFLLGTFSLEKYLLGHLGCDRDDTKGLVCTIITRDGLPKKSIILRLEKGAMQCGGTVEHSKKMSDKPFLVSGWPKALENTAV